MDDKKINETLFCEMFLRKHPWSTWAEPFSRWMEKNRLWKLVMRKATVSRAEDDSISLYIYPNLPR